MGRKSESRFAEDCERAQRERREDDKLHIAEDHVPTDRNDSLRRENEFLYIHRDTVRFLECDGEEEEKERKERCQNLPPQKKEKDAEEGNKNANLVGQALAFLEESQKHFVANSVQRRGQSISKTEDDLPTTETVISHRESKNERKKR